MAQSLDRHSPIDLTMDVYSHVALEERAQAVAGLPMPSQVGRTTAPESKRSPEVDSLGNTKMVPQVVPPMVPNACRRMTTACYRSAPASIKRGLGMRPMRLHATPTRIDTSALAVTQ